MKKILMCLSTEFDVNYTINPWMIGNVNKVDKFKAVQQWNELRNSLVESGVDVIVLPQPPSNCPDAVFTANAGLLYRDMYIPSRFRYAERVPEEKFFLDWFLAHGFKVDMSSNFDNLNRETFSFEGAGDALFSADRKNLWLGFGFRTSFYFRPHLEKLFEGIDCMIRPLNLVNSKFYHLDTCFCPLDTGELLWYPAAFSEHSQYVIETWYAGKEIRVSYEDALRFACNSVSVGETIVMPQVSKNLKNKLATRGYNVKEVDMSQYLLSGGACKCLTLEIIE